MELKVELNNAQYMLKILNDNYSFKFTKIKKHRDMIGYVYIAYNATSKYIFKIFRPFNTNEALQSLEILEYLKLKDYPAVRIIKTSCNSSYIKVNTLHGNSIGILYEFINGSEPNLTNDLIAIARQVSCLHNIMKEYPNKLIKRGKEFYIDRYISLLQDLNYCSAKISDLAKLGNELWAKMIDLPNGFCHGDLHTGNMLKVGNKYIIFDFDVSSYTHSVIDVAILSDRTNFNILEKSAYENTKIRFEKFYTGYQQYMTLSKPEIESIFSFIAIRHYELIATITECQGAKSLRKEFLNEQYDWLIKWNDLCSRYQI